ncbi:MAG: amylo-alpha-1,6-glucosidase [Pseudomonadota bacterium]|nr:amylo-alpha-1,6-glucosidase [Pseudomonadota bacterium]
MTFKVQVGPPQIAIHQGQTVLVSDPDGGIASPSVNGLYFFDTRLISSWAAYANGQSWDLLNGGAVSYDASRIYLANRAFVTADGIVPVRTIGFVLGRAIEGGLHEDLDLTNHGSTTVKFHLEIALRCDFADVFEVKSDRIIRRGHITTDWADDTQRLTTAYSNADFYRGVTVGPRSGGPRATYANGRLSFDIGLEPGETWHCCLLYDLVDAQRRFPAPLYCEHESAESSHAAAMASWRKEVLNIRTSNEEFYRFFNQAVSDMAALRLPEAELESGPASQPDGDAEHMSFVPAAGLPWFVALFGRDSLIVSLQNMLIYPSFATATLDVLGRLQATARDDFRDAEPGKILHELRYGELAHFKLIPHTPYYGTADATPLYLITLHEAWRWTGDQGLLARHLRTAEACLEWIDAYGDRDGDGFQEYQTRSPDGYENMAWKDAGDSVPDLDGTLVKGPKALCELQGYVYDAWTRMAEIYDALGRQDRALELREKAQALYQRFNEAFWDEAGGFYAYCLDGEKKPILTVASNPGHCLWSGIVPPERAARVVQRLMSPDMWSGWGIRTLSAKHPSYNPYSYQNGSVWPHDNAIIALGFQRYGFAAEAARIARDISAAASHFELNQVPELYAGTQRDAVGFPVQYLGANVPQAWAAGSAFMLLNAILGLTPDAPNGWLIVDPALPPWLPDVTLLGLRLGGQTLDLRFWREDDATHHEVLKGDQAAVLRRRR